MKKFFLIIILTLFVFESAHTNERYYFIRSSTCNNFFSNFKSDFQHFIGIGVQLFISPSQFHQDDLKRIGIIAGSAASLFLIDKDIRNFAQSYQSKTNNRVFQLDDYYGNKYTFYLTLSTYVLGYFSRKEAVRETGLLSMEAFLYSGFITNLLKVFIGRRRPNGGENHLVFKPFQFKTHYKSLPSGHSTVSFAVSTIMAKSWNNLFWKTFWYGSAAMVAVSRIYHNAHWISDIFSGGMIGYSIAHFINKYNCEREDNLNIHSFQSFQIYINGNKLGFILQF